MVTRESQQFTKTQTRSTKSNIPLWHFTVHKSLHCFGFFFQEKVFTKKKKMLLTVSEEILRSEVQDEINTCWGEL